MESSFIQNLRRSPRVRARCAVQVATATGLFAAATEDVSAPGCRLASPRRLAVGEAVRLALRHAGLTTHLRVPGKVVWSSGRAPWSLGIEFDPAARPQCARWFSQLLRYLGVPPSQGLPELVPLSAVVYLGAPPLVPAELAADELALLQAVREGATVTDLLSRFAGRRSAMERALFSLLGQRYATLSRTEAVHPTVWRAVLAALATQPPGPALPAADGSTPRSIRAGGGPPASGLG